MALHSDLFRLGSEPFGMLEIKIGVSSVQGKHFTHSTISLAFKVQSPWCDFKNLWESAPVDACSALVPKSHTPNSQ